MVTSPLPHARRPAPAAMIALVFTLGLLAACGDDDTDPTAAETGAQPVAPAPDYPEKLWGRD